MGVATREGGRGGNRGPEEMRKKQQEEERERSDRGGAWPQEITTWVQKKNKGYSQKGGQKEKEVDSYGPNRLCRPKTTARPHNHWCQTTYIFSRTRSGGGKIIEK